MSYALQAWRSYRSKDLSSCLNYLWAATTHGLWDLSLSLEYGMCYIGLLIILPIVDLFDSLELVSLPLWTYNIKQPDCLHLWCPCWAESFPCGNIPLIWTASRVPMCLRQSEFPPLAWVMWLGRFDFPAMRYEIGLFPWADGAGFEHIDGFVARIPHATKYPNLTSFIWHTLCAKVPRSWNQSTLKFVGSFL